MPLLLVLLLVGCELLLFRIVELERVFLIELLELERVLRILLRVFLVFVLARTLFLFTRLDNSERL